MLWLAPAFVGAAAFWIMYADMYRTAATYLPWILGLLNACILQTCDLPVLYWYHIDQGNQGTVDANLTRLVISVSAMCVPVLVNVAVIARLYSPTCSRGCISFCLERLTLPVMFSVWIILVYATSATMSNLFTWLKGSRGYVELSKVGQTCIDCAYLSVFCSVILPGLRRIAGTLICWFRAIEPPLYIPRLGETLPNLPARAAPQPERLRLSLSTSRRPSLFNFEDNIMEGADIHDVELTGLNRLKKIVLRSVAEEPQEYKNEMDIALNFFADVTCDCFRFLFCRLLFSQFNVYTLALVVTKDFVHSCLNFVFRFWQPAILLSVVFDPQADKREIEAIKMAESMLPIGVRIAYKCLSAHMKYFVNMRNMFISTHWVIDGNDDAYVTTWINAEAIEKQQRAMGLAGTRKLRQPAATLRVLNEIYYLYNIVPEIPWRPLPSQSSLCDEINIRLPRATMTSAFSKVQECIHARWEVRGVIKIVASLTFLLGTLVIGQTGVSEKVHGYGGSGTMEHLTGTKFATALLVADCLEYAFVASMQNYLLINKKEFKSRVSRVLKNRLMLISITGFMLHFACDAWFDLLAPKFC